MSPRRNRSQSTRRLRRRGARAAPTDDPAIDALYGLEPPIGGGETEPDPEATGLQAAAIDCPYCGERIETLLDLSAGSAAYIEDCQVCCQPIELSVQVDENGALLALTAARGD